MSGTKSTTPTQPSEGSLLDEDTEDERDSFVEYGIGSSPDDAMEFVARNSSNALSSADFSLNYQVTIVDRHIGSRSLYW
jgi:hypothetical protein